MQKAGHGRLCRIGCRIPATCISPGFPLTLRRRRGKRYGTGNICKSVVEPDKYNREYRFSTWIYTIAGNVCYDRLRSLQHSPSGSMQGISLANIRLSSGEDMEQSLINKELKELILRFTHELTPKQKLVFTLREIEGLEVSEVEAITGMSAEKIKSNLYQARKQIRIKINLMEDYL